MSCSPRGCEPGAYTHRALLTFVEDRDALDVWLTSDVPFRFGLRSWCTMFHSAPTAPELAALTAEEGAERCDAKRFASILILRSSMAPSSSGAPREESADSDNLSRTPSELFELAASDILKSSAPVAGSTLEAGILLGWEERVQDQPDRRPCPISAT